MVLLGRFLLQQTRQRPDLRNVKSVNYKRIAIVIVCTVGALFPIYFYPLYNSKSYREIQDKARLGIDQEQIQPGGMRVWSDPFAPRPDKKE